MRVVTRRSRQGRLYNESPERKIELLDPEHASGLYDALHSSPVLVLAFRATFVRRDPRRDPPERRHAIDLRRFVAHKAVHALPLDERAIDEAFGRFHAWVGGCHNEGRDDPRTLPLHVFESSPDWGGLGSDSPDREFRKRHGKPSVRRDDGGRVWRRADAQHGRPVLTVAGARLAAGMHWDVATSSTQTELCAGHQVWSLRRGTGYLNVYPNATVRKSLGRSNAKRVWPRPAG